MSATTDAPRVFAQAYTSNQLDSVPVRKMIRFKTECYLATHKNETIERFWPYSGGQSWAYLTKNHHTKQRRLYVNDRLIYEGEFSLAAHDFVWSPNGKHFGVHIYPKDDPYQNAYLLSSKKIRHEFSGQFLREFLIDDHGRIAALILSDGEVFDPYVYERHFRNFASAANLRWTNTGSIAFDAVFEDESFLITDETELSMH